MELRFGTPASQIDYQYSPTPFPHVITRFLRKDHGDVLSESYSGRRFSATIAAESDFKWASDYVDAGPAIYRKYFPRVYACGALGMTVDTHRTFTKSYTVPLAAQELTFGFPSETAPSYQPRLKADAAATSVWLTTPAFSASIKLVLPASGSEQPLLWEFGWIQGCLAYEATAKYDNGGSVTYELPEYGARTGGGCSATPATERGGVVPWYDEYARAALHTAVDCSVPSLVQDRASPVGGDSSSRLRDVTLSCQRESCSPAFSRDFFQGIEFCQHKHGVPDGRLISVRLMQKYRAWLVLRDASSGSCVILRSVTWSNDVRSDGSNVCYYRNAIERDSPSYFMPEATLEAKSNLADSLQAVYSHELWGDIRLSQLLSHRPLS